MLPGITEISYGSKSKKNSFKKSSSRCFICSSASHKNTKIFIFGKSSLGIAEVIQFSLSVDLSRYSGNSELFVCMDKCYQRLIKFNQASDKLKELKKINRRSLQGKRKWFSIYFYIPRQCKPRIISRRECRQRCQNTSTSSPRGKASKYD